MIPCDPRRTTLLLLLAAAPLHAQASDTVAPPPAAATPETLITLGSPAEDRLRLRQIVGEDSAAGYLLRSTHTLAPPLPAAEGEFRWAPVLPLLRLVRNSRLPFSINDGALWAGRGWNAALTGGVRAVYGPVSLIAAPELLYQQNSAFQTIDFPTGERSRFASPFHPVPGSLDAPLRFGDEPRAALGFGQSSLVFAAGPAELGLSAEDQWWGPGVRNAILLSNNAAGVPHLFVRTATPVRTAIGWFEGKWLVGALSESAYFDGVAANDTRSLSAVAATYRPVWEPDLTLGAARAVYAPTSGLSEVPSHLLDAARYFRAPADGPDTPDQFLSLFGRWIFPASGAEVYAEWARHARPDGVRDLLVAPHHGQGYTVGAQWARPVRDGDQIRLGAELTNLEQSATFRQRSVGSFYESAAVPQGYTQRGQVLGAAIGPGASSQWVVADYVAAGWQLGIVAERIRWDDDAFYRLRPGANILSHDVSWLRGVRGTFRLGGFDVAAEWITGTRFNYLFQNNAGFLSQLESVDIPNRTLRLLVTPSLGGTR